MAKMQIDIDFIAERLRKGAKSQDIFANFCKELRKVSKRTFDDRLGEARKVLAAQQAIINTKVNEVIEEQLDAQITALRSDLEIEEQLLKIGFGELDIEETTSTPNGMIVNNRKPTPAEMKAALAEVWKKRGVYAADKVEQTIVVKIPDDN